MRRAGADRALSALRQRWPLLTTVLLTVLGAVLATWPLARHVGSAALRDGEVLLTAWQLNWFQHALLTDPLNWADANIFFPYANAATFNDLLLTHAVITLPAAWADSPVLALNLAFLGGIVLCGVCAYALVVELTGDRWAGAVAGTLFALAPFRFLHVGHLSIAAAWAIPLFVWTLLRHLRSPSWAAAATAVVSGLAVSFSSLYHAAYLAPVLPFVVWFGWRRGPGGRAVWLPLVTAAVPGLALLAWVLSPFLATMQTFGVAAAPDDLVRFGADLTSLTQRPEFIGGSAPEHIDDEAQLYPGAGLGVLALASALLATFTALKAQRGWRRHAMVAALVVFAAAGSHAARRDHVFARADIPASEPATVELLRDGDVVATWTMGAEWATYSAEVPVSAVGPAIYRSRCAPRQAPCAGWPETGTLLRWRLSSAEGQIQIRDLSFSAPD